MEREDVINKVKRIFLDRLKVDIREEQFDKPLFGAELKLLSSDMVYIFFDLEKEFTIEIIEEDIDNECLMTMNTIVKMIEKKKG